VTLGDGADEFVFAWTSRFSSLTTVTDFEAGAGGDVVDLNSLIPGTDEEFNPFGTGRALLVKDGADTVL